VFQKELYNGIPNATAWRVLRKRLHLKAYQLSVVQAVKLRQRGRPTRKTIQLSDKRKENEKLIADPKRVPDTNKGWANDRSKINVASNFT
jgi:hypothetical protein